MTRQGATSAGNDDDTGHAPPLLTLQLLPLQTLMLPQRLLLLLLLRLLLMLLLRLPLLMLLRPLLRLLPLLRQQGWSMPDQSCCCDFFLFLLVHDEMDETTTVETPFEL